MKELRDCSVDWVQSPLDGPINLGAINPSPTETKQDIIDRLCYDLDVANATIRDKDLSLKHYENVVKTVDEQTNVLKKSVSNLNTYMDNWRLRALKAEEELLLYKPKPVIIEQYYTLSSLFNLTGCTKEIAMIKVTFEDGKAKSSEVVNA